MTTYLPSTLVLDEPPPTSPPAPIEWRLVARAIRDYLRHTYAPHRLGIPTDLVPLRLSAYNGKGLGYYPMGADGRAEWSDEFHAYIARAERRTPRDRDLRFGYAELAGAMDALQLRYPLWHTVLMALDVHGVRIEDFCLETGRDLSAVKRLRRKATFFLYEELRLNRTDDDERVAFVIYRVF